MRAVEDGPEAPLVVLLDRETMGDARFRRLSAPHRWIEHERTRPEQVVERLRGATVALVNKVVLGPSALEELPRLRLVAVMATGTDNVDREAASRLGVEIRNVVGYGSVSVAEHVITLLLALAKGLVPHREAVLDGSWTRGGQFCHFAAPVRSLAGMRLGLIGRGAIGEAVAERARSLGMDVVFAARQSERPGSGRLAFEEVLETSDAISLHCPLVAETRHLLDERAFARCKPGVLIINTARGALIDELALEAALDSGRVGGAGLDVAPVEPPPAAAVILRLARRSNVIVTPHMAWTSRDAMQRLADQVIDNVDRFLAASGKGAVEREPEAWSKPGEM